MSRDDFLEVAREFEADSDPEWYDAKHAAWERTAAKRLVKALGLNPLAGMNREDHPLSLFRKAFPDFPYLVVSRYAAGMHKYRDLIELDKRFTKTDIYRAWVEEVDSLEGTECPIAMLAPWGEWTTVVVHDSKVDLKANGTVLVKVIRDRLVIVEPLSRWAEWVREAWRP